MCYLCICISPPFLILNLIVLCCPVTNKGILFYPVLFYPILSYPILSYPILSSCILCGSGENGAVHSLCTWYAPSLKSRVKMS